MAKKKKKKDDEKKKFEYSNEVIGIILILASIIGIVLGAVMVVFGILWGNGVSALQNFVDVPSIIITLGGSLAGLIASNTLKDFLNNFKGVGLAFKDPKYDNGSTIAKIIELSNVARKEGLLALEEVAQNLDDEFMKKGILLIVDGTEPELVRGILETELMNMDERHRSVAGFFETWAALGPAWGMIGTLIGLVNMLKDLQDSSAIGPSMATALLTTLYGSLIANWFCTPIANKLKEQNSIEYQLKEIVIEGLLSIQAGENPRVIEEKLKSFLAPASRNALSTEEGGGEA